MPTLAPDFARLLAPGTTYPLLDDGTTVRVKELPGVPLSLPTGRVIAMEPFLCGWGDPEEATFTEHVAPGTYPVVLSVVDVISPDGTYGWDTRVAAARLQIREEPVVRWELALTPGQDMADLGEGELYGYAVDGGTGCFLDASTFQALGDGDDDGDEEEDFADRVVSAMWVRRPGAPEGSSPDRVDDPITLPVGDDKHGVIVFGTGWGDGVYPTWIGRTADDEIACFLTDFQAVGTEDDD